MSSTALAEHERLLQALLHGDALPGPVAGRVLVRTHISSLVLAGRFAYKLRQPLKLPFLDFSSAALRHDDCLRELRLNRRTAPMLYLDVRPVLGTADAPRLGEPDEGADGDGAPAPIDWLLRMRRFEPGQLLDAMAREGRLTAAHVDALAREMAAFHAALVPSPPRFGGAEAVRGVLVETLDAIAAHPLARPQRECIGVLRARLLDDCSQLAPLIEQRRAEGFVREGHGDLHLANIVLLDGVPRPFDGIEFNDALRHIDVVYDIAFTFMDLLRQGLPSLAWRFVGVYAEHTGDFAGLALLRFFAAGRALVRARVALLRDEGAGAAFLRDLSLAGQLAARCAEPAQLTLVCGLSGSGKSTAALELAQRLGGIRLRSDVERKRLHGLAPTDRPTPAQAATLYARDATVRTYARLGDIARTLLHFGVDAIVDAAALRRDERDALRQIAAGEGAGFALVECVAPEATLRERIVRRAEAGGDPSDADGAVLDLQLRVREPVTAAEAAFTLPNDGDAAAMVQRCAALAGQLAARAATIAAPATARRPS